MAIFLPVPPATFSISVQPIAAAPCQWMSLGAVPAKPQRSHKRVISIASVTTSASNDEFCVDASDDEAQTEQRLAEPRALVCQSSSQAPRRTHKRVISLPSTFTPAEPHGMDTGSVPSTFQEDSPPVARTFIHYAKPVASLSRSASAPAILLVSKERNRKPKHAVAPEQMELLGTDALPTLGSANHYRGKCKPCAFAYKEGGCTSGVNCVFCHLCDSEERRRRRKEKAGQRRARKQQAA